MALFELQEFLSQLVVQMGKQCVIPAQEASCRKG